MTDLEIIKSLVDRKFQVRAQDVFADLFNNRWGVYSPGYGSGWIKMYVDDTTAEIAGSYSGDRLKFFDAATRHRWNNLRRS